MHKNTPNTFLFWHAKPRKVSRMLSRENPDKPNAQLREAIISLRKQGRTKGAQKKKVGLVTVGEKSSDAFNFFLTKKFFNKVAARPS